MISVYQQKQQATQIKVQFSRKVPIYTFNAYSTQNYNSQIEITHHSSTAFVFQVANIQIKL